MYHVAEDFSPGEGATTMFAGTACAIVVCCLFLSGNIFCGIIFRKIISWHKFLSDILGE